MSGQLHSSLGTARDVLYCNAADAAWRMVTFAALPNKMSSLSKKLARGGKLERHSPLKDQQAHYRGDFVDEHLCMHTLPDAHPHTTCRRSCTLKRHPGDCLLSSRCSLLL